MRRPYKRLIGVFGAVVIIATGVLAADYLRFLHTPVDADARGTFVIESGMSVPAVARRLADTEVIDRPLYFRATARLTGAARSIQAGEYDIGASSTPYRLLEKFVAGDVKTYTLTVVEGWTFAQMMEAMRRHDAIEHTLDGLEPAEIVERLGHGDRHFEGRFFPDTYQFVRGTRDVELLGRGFERMQRVLDEEWRERSGDLPLETPADALVLASIIERETGVPDERDRIAGVFVERLERGMRLQTDPTVIYGLGNEFRGDLRYRHLRRDTPYNTYTRSGLPPTPIALPSREAIHAALHPDRRGELYFVSTGAGRHVFSETLREHNEAVIEYQLDGDASRLRTR